MLTWFEQQAPIRTKFSVLLIIYSSLGAGSVAATCWAALGGGVALPVAISVVLLAATVLTAAVSAKLVCTPYVNTVIRMEHLADGDLDSPINYTNFGDCVGRMTKAMTTFRGNAVAIQQLMSEQDAIVPPMRDALSHLANADLTHRVTQIFPGEHDVLRTQFNAAVDTLQATIGSVSDSTGRVHSAAVEIRAASDDLAKRTEQQAASLQLASADMNAVTALVVENTGSVVEVNKSVADAHREATNGGRVVEDAVAAMGMIQSSANQISQIVNVIDGIAFQTNLLALNAGVEAARAGDAGRGFAVVATEVRALAQRSADAAREIKDLITTSGQHVERGVALVGETGKALGQIVGRVGEVSRLVEGIAQSATRQTEMLGNVNTAVSQMDTMTQQNAAMVEQTTAAARSLAEEANILTDSVSKFSHGSAAISIRGPNAAPAAVPRDMARAASAQVASDGPVHAQRSATAVKTRPVNANLALKAVPRADWADF